jgi:ribosomal-protein-alanine N-acetyltransferase
MFTFNAPDRVKTSRLTLRLPDDDDAESVFAYASDPVATRYMSWPIHVNIEDTYAFFEFAEREWESSGIGPYLVVRGGAVIGSTGLQLAANGRIGTGYILARSEWGKGYGTEVCRAMVEVAQGEGIREIATY